MSHKGKKKKNKEKKGNKAEAALYPDKVYAQFQDFDSATKGLAGDGQVEFFANPKTLFDNNEGETETDGSLTVAVYEFKGMVRLKATTTVEEKPA